MISTRNVTILAALAGMLVLIGADSARAAPAKPSREQFLKILGSRITMQQLNFVPMPSVLDPRIVRPFDRDVQRFLRRGRIPRITPDLLTLPPEVINFRREFILERYRLLAERRGGRAFGGIFPGPGTEYIPQAAINIFTFFPVFRI